MAKEKQIIIKEAEITNNCPECFNQKLTLTFFQRHTYNPFYHRTTDQVSSEIKCQKCESIIYPVKWTEDIERVFDYYNKLVEPDRNAVRFTTLFFALLLLFLGAVSTLLYLYLEGAI